MDTRTVNLSVDVTTGLLTDQQLTVSWSGARPSNFTYTDPTSNYASTIEEYPMVLLECRGVDDQSKPAAQQLSPRTCWTQYDAERGIVSYGTAFPPWRLDRDASPSDRVQDPNQPASLPDGCFASTFGLAAYTLPLLSSDGTTYNQYVCNGTRAPEQQEIADTGLPDNSTFAATRTDGSGLSKFVIWSDETNATLGCSSTVPCTLVAIPIMGINCDEEATTAAGAAAADIASCEYQDPNSGATGSSTGTNHAGSPSVTGQLWWSASNWDNRFSVPLTFAPPASYCSTVSTKSPVLVYGSELMTQAAQQWAPAFCTDPSQTPFADIPEAEPAAVNTLTQGSTEAAFDSDPPSADASAGVPIINAPVAVTGFAIGTLVDAASGTEDTAIRLNPRLLAKLLSESYPVLSNIATGDGGAWGTDATGAPVLQTPGPMANNPLDVTEDPEFRALNPTIAARTGAGAPSHAELIALSSDSDVMHALTSYINADPAARAFLDGTPDPWGMVVNPNYKSIVLPTDFWDLKDTYIDTELAKGDPCWASSQLQVPYLSLVAAPLLQMANITQNIEFGLPNSTTICVKAQTSNGVNQLSTDQRQIPGNRFTLGVVSLGEAHLYGLDTAELQTQTTVAPSAKFTSGDGSTFAAATPDSVKAAASQFKADSESGTWTLDYTGLRTNAASAAAYPGTMIVSMSVPTVGLSASDAQAYSALLKFAAGNGQTSGTGFGQLPAGYVPMTAANGLGALVDYTNRAATAVAAQGCELPQVTGSTTVTASASACPSPSPSPSPSPTPSPTPTATQATAQPQASPAPQAVVPSVPHLGQTGGQQSAPTTAAAPSTAASNSAPAAVAPVSSEAAPQVQQTGFTRGVPVGPIGNLVPGLLLFAAAVGTIALVVHAIADSRSRPQLLVNR